MTTHRFALLAVLLACASMGAGAVELRGFRGFAWGSDVDSLGDARQVSSEGGVQCYRRERENLFYGDSALREVRYCFHEGRLFLVVVDSNADSATLAAEFQSTYGPPAQRMAHKATWGDSGSRARVEISGVPASMRIWSNEYTPRSARIDMAHQR
jgi:hypothetical protein